MKNLSPAIFGKLAGSTLDGLIGGRFYEGEAPQKAAFPYVVYSVVSDVPEYPGGKTIESVMVQFSIFSNTSGCVEADNILDALRALYDDCSLTITSNTLIYFIRENMTPMREAAETPEGSGVWHYAQDYEIQFVN